MEGVRKAQNQPQRQTVNSPPSVNTKQNKGYLSHHKMLNSSSLQHQSPISSATINQTGHEEPSKALKQGLHTTSNSRTRALPDANALKTVAHEASSNAKRSHSRQNNVQSIPSKPLEGNDCQRSKPVVTRNESAQAEITASSHSLKKISSLHRGGQFIRHPCSRSSSDSIGVTQFERAPATRSDSSFSPLQTNTSTSAKRHDQGSASKITVPSLFDETTDGTSQAARRRQQVSNYQACSNSSSTTQRGTIQSFARSRSRKAIQIEMLNLLRQPLPEG